MSAMSIKPFAVLGDRRLLDTVELMREQGVLISGEELRQRAIEQSAKNYARMMKEEREEAEAETAVVMAAATAELSSVAIESQVEIEVIEEREATPVRHLRLVA